jgi:hypothetical protein
MPEFDLDTQRVIAMRLIKITFGGPAGAAEWVGKPKRNFGGLITTPR